MQRAGCASKDTMTVYLRWCHHANITLVSEKYTHKHSHLLYLCYLAVFLNPIEFSTICAPCKLNIAPHSPSLWRVVPMAGAHCYLESYGLFCESLNKVLAQTCHGKVLTQTYQLNMVSTALCTILHSLHKSGVSQSQSVSCTE